MMSGILDNIMTFILFWGGMTVPAFAAAEPSPERDDALWIGAIADKDSRLPKGDDFHTWGMSEEDLCRWQNIDTLASRSIMLRKEFMLGGGIVSAKVSVCGLGHYALFLNGTEIAPEEIFKPLWSEYSKTIYYNEYDVTSVVQSGKNAIGVILGNGMYNVTGGRYVKFRHSYGPPTLLLQLDIRYVDGTEESIVTDGSWKYAPSPVIFNCIFGGEDYDARLEQPGWTSAGFGDSLWRDVVVQEAPQGRLKLQEAPHIGVSETFEVQDVWSPGSDRLIFDLGQNHSGIPTICVTGTRGQKITLAPAERIEKDSSAIIQVTSGAPYRFEYTLKGAGTEEWTPDFSFYGYRYIEVTGAAYRGMPETAGDDMPELLSLQSGFVHLSAASTGSFECSNPLFNRIHFIIDKAVRSNMHAVFTDCPHREKLGWLEETHLNGPGLLFNYDLRNVLPKVMRDIADSQRPDGLIPDIAPEYVVFKDGFVDSPEWGAAGAVLPWMYYIWYGDDSLIREYYPVMRKYTDYLASKSAGYILEYGLGDWCDYGPAPAGFSQNTPAGITATSHFFIVAECTAKAAAMVGDRSGKKKYSELGRNIAKAFNDRFFDTATCVYGNGSQCSYAMPLFLGIVPGKYKDRVLANFLESVRKADGRLTTGDIGNRYLFQTLSRNGFDEVMYDMHNHTGLPGYGYQIKAGVTTLAEQWNPELGLSWNHFMMGQIEEWFYRALGGINPDPDNPGFAHFFIRPSAPGDLQWVRCSYESVKGLIESDWKKEDGKFILSVTVPENTEATVILPYSKRKMTARPGKHGFEESLTF